MTRTTILPVLVIALASAVPALAQAGMGQPPVRYGNGTTTGQTGRGNKQPCWQVAGVSKSAMEQERALREEARSKMESVCSNTSMSPQQKREEVCRIEESVHQRMSSVITPQQQSALHSCRTSRGEGGHMGGMGGGGMHGGGGGMMHNCGEMPGGGTGTGTGTGNGAGMPTPQPGIHN